MGHLLREWVDVHHRSADGSCRCLLRIFGRDVFMEQIELSPIREGLAGHVLWHWPAERGFITSQEFAGERGGRIRAWFRR